MSDTNLTGELRHRQVSVDGSSLHVMEAGDTGAPPVLLVHGWATSRASPTKSDGRGPFQAAVVTDSVQRGGPYRLVCVEGPGLPLPPRTQCGLTLKSCQLRARERLLGGNDRA